MDVFISYHTNTSLEVVKQIGEHLQKMGITYWYASEDMKNGPFAKQIIEAIEECKVFLLVLNSDASNSEHCLNEIKIAFERVEKKENIAIFPFRIHPGDIGKEAKYYLGRMHWFDAITPTLEERIYEIGLKIDYCIKNPNNNHIGAVANWDYGNNIKNSRFYENPHYIGRNSEINEIKELLENNRVLFVQGMGGLGKSELVRQFAFKYNDYYSEIVYATYESNLLDLIINNNNLLYEFPRMRDEHGKPESDEEYAKRKMERFKDLASDRTLVILDNFDVDNDDYLELFLNGNYQVLITTRNNFEDMPYAILKLGELLKEDQFLLFKEYCKMPLKDTDMADLEKILDILQGHTLAIEILAKYEASARIKLAKLYENIVQGGFMEKVSGNVVVGTKTTRAELCLRNLFKLDNLSDEELYILKIMTVVPIEGIEISELADLCELEDCCNISQLIRRSWLLYDMYNDVVALHPLIAEVVEKELSIKFTDFDTYIRSLGDIVKDSWNLDFAKKTHYYELVKKLLMKFHDFPNEYLDEFRDFVRLSGRLEYHKECLTLMTQYKDKVVELFGENSVEAINAYFYLGDSYAAALDDDNGFVWLEKMVQCSIDFYPEEMKTGYYAKHLAWVYLGAFLNYDRVKELLNICGDIYKKFLDEKDPQIASLNSAYALLYYEKGEYEKSRDYAQVAYDVFNELNGEHNPDTLAPMSILSIAKSKLGEHEAALELCNKVISIQKEINGETHLKVLKRLRFKGLICHDMGDYEGEKECLTYIMNELNKNGQTYVAFYEKVKSSLENIGNK